MFAEHSETSSKRVSGNIRSLCDEVNFNIKVNDLDYAYKNLSTKLKFIYDIKNKEDMVSKVNSL